MFDIKSLLIVITLVLITIIHYGFAPPREKTQNQIDCEHLMSGRWFESRDSASCGKRNFIRSFNNYTFSTIYNKYNPPENGNETNDQRQTRLLKRKLYTSYFLDLGVTFTAVFPNEHTHSPIKWCTFAITGELNIVKEEQQDEIVKEEQQDENQFKIFNCMEIIQNHFKIDGGQQPHEIFSKLYDDYTIDNLKNISDLPINYPLGYFEHYVDKIKYKFTKQRVEFKTIEAFCRLFGKNMVAEKGTLEDTVPMA